MMLKTYRFRVFVGVVIFLLLFAAAIELISHLVEYAVELLVEGVNIAELSREDGDFFYLGGIIFIIVVIMSFVSAMFIWYWFMKKTGFVDVDALLMEKRNESSMRGLDGGEDQG